MKLIFCLDCQDIVKGSQDVRTCHCGASGIQYHDELHATYWGSAVPIGFLNRSLSEAIQRRPTSGDGVYFTAFVIPEVCDTFEKVDK